MVTFNETKFIGDGMVYCEGVCLSTDTKPKDDKIMNGSKLLEMDTSTLYMYDKASKTWKAWE